MSPELFELGWKGLVLIFSAGVLYGELREIKKAIKRLEEKQDKYNHLQERMTRREVFCALAHPNRKERSDEHNAAL